MNNVQLYIEGQRVDLFDEKGIEVRSSLQDIRDVGSIFTDFSQSFSVPASPINNRTFGHFYNPNITRGGYDSREKKSAIIFINHIEFRKGYIQLNSVEMRNNKPHTYKITFFGSTVRIKDLLKDDKLDALCDSSKTNNLSLYDHPYSPSDVKTGFTSGLDRNSKTDSIIYPLITAKKRLFFDSATPSSYAGNVYSVGTQAAKGVAYTDLKPAIKAIHVIEAIEGKYGIEFTRDFLDTEAFTSLYLWLSSASGDILDYKFRGDEMKTINIEGLQNADTSDFTFPSDATVSFNIPRDTTAVKSSDVIVVNLRTTPVTSPTNDTTKNYTVKIIDTITGEILAEQNGSGTQTIKYKRNYGQVYTARDYNLKFVVETFVGIAFNAELSVEKVSWINRNQSPAYVSAVNPEGGPFSTTSRILLEHHLPDMKVIDFLSGIFKMFNLVAFYIDDETDTDFGKIKLMTLDSFYADATNNATGGMIDIREYVDISSSTIEASLPFTSISFKYEDTDTVLMENHFVDHNEVFGNAEYTPDGYTEFGKKYEIKVPFSHLKYEHLLDLGDDLSETEIQWGYAAGGNFNEDDGNYSSQNIKPLLFYGINHTISSSSTYINWISGTEDAIATYWRPSNSNEAASKTVPPDFTINFDAEVDEFYLTDYSSVFPSDEDDFEQATSSNSLFKKFYRKYITSSLNPLKRIVKIKAYLPPKVLVRYKLNDQLKIHHDVYRINSIRTNLVTGKSELELINLFDSEIAQ